MMPHDEKYTVIIRSEFDHTTHTIQYDSPHISSDHIIRDFITSFHRRKQNQLCMSDGDDDEYIIGKEESDTFYVTCCTKVLRSGLFLDTDYRLLSHRTHSPLHVQLHLSGALRGGKGGFGAQLRAQGTKVGQKKTTNFSGCRDLHGRRLRDVRDERRLRQWYTEQEQRERAEVERREQERREHYTEQRETVMTEHGNMIKKQTELVQSAVMSGLLQQQKKKNKEKKMMREEEEENGRAAVVNEVENNSDDMMHQDYVSGSSSGSDSNGANSNGANSNGSSSSSRSSEKRKKDGVDKKGKRKKRKTSALFASEFDHDSDSDNSESEL